MSWVFGRGFVGVVALCVAAALLGAAPVGGAAADGDAQGGGVSLGGFDAGGRVVDVAALFESGGGVWFSSSGWRGGSSGRLVDGDVGLGSGGELLVRVMSVGSAVLRLNDAGSLVMREFFGVGGAGRDLWVHVVTDDGVAVFAVGAPLSAGSNYVNFVVPEAHRGVLDGIEQGDRFVFALTSPAPEPATTTTTTTTPTTTTTTTTTTAAPNSINDNDDDDPNSTRNDSDPNDNDDTSTRNDSGGGDGGSGDGGVDASLGVLSLGGGFSLSPVFAGDVVVYGALVGHDTQRVTVDAVASDPAASVSIKPADADLVAAGHQVDVRAPSGSAEASTVVEATVTAADGATRRMYTLRVRRPARVLSSDYGFSGVLGVASGLIGSQPVAGFSFRGGGLGSLEVTAVDDPVRERFVGSRGFVTGLMWLPGTYELSPRIGEFTDAVVLMSGSLRTPFELVVNGRSYGSGAASASNARGNADRFWVWEDPCANWQTGSELTVTYTPETDSAAVLGSTDASLGSLSLAGAALGEDFASGTLDYSAVAGLGAQQVTVDAAPSDPNACSVAVSPADADPDTAGHQIDLAAENNVISVEVTAADGTTTRSYAVTVNWPTNDAALQTLSVSPGALSPAFDSDTAAYTASVGVEEVTVAADARHADATVSISPADIDPDTAGHQVFLTAGDNAVSVEVTAADGATTETYTVTVTRVPPNDDSSLQTLSVDPGALSPRLRSGTVLYSGTFDAEVKSVTLTAVAAHPRATVLIGPADADPVAAGHQVKLRSGENPVTIRVTAQDGVSTSTYVVTLTRAAPASPSDATLSALSVDLGTPISFDPATEWYWVYGWYWVSRHPTVAWTPTDPNANVTVTPADADANVAGHQVDVGSIGDRSGTEVKVVVEAADGATTRTYTVALYRGTGWAKIDSGDRHHCGLRVNGQVVCWGTGISSQDGRVKWAPPGGVYQDIHVGKGHSCGTRTDGRFECWSKYRDGWMSSGTQDGVAYFDAGTDRSVCWVSGRGRVACENSAERLPSAVRAGRQQMVSTGSHLGCAIDLVGGLVCWESRGTLNTPSGQFKFISVDHRSACGIRLDGSLVCWKYKFPYRHYTIEFQDRNRVYVEADTTDDGHPCGLTSDGQLRCKHSSPTGWAILTSMTAAAVRGTGIACGINENADINCWNARHLHNIPIWQGTPPWNRRPTNWPPEVHKYPHIREVRIDGTAVRVNGNVVDTVTVPATQATADIKVFPWSASAGVTFSAADSDSAVPGHQLALATGTNTFTVSTTAETRGRRTYTITIIRSAA